MAADSDKAVTVTPEQQSIMPLVAPEMALRAWQTFQEMCSKLLDDTDYATIKGKKARKRSGFTKLALFYGITVLPRNDSEPHFWQQGDDWGFDWVLVASRGERHVPGDGSCSYSEMKDGPIVPTRHNIRSKAETRAFNRAVANFLGTGEVSAEELDTNGAGKAQVVEGEYQEQQEGGKKTEETKLCPIHGETMKRAIGKKSGKPYWFHKWDEYERGFCYGHEPKPKVEASADADAEGAA